MKESNLQEMGLILPEGDTLELYNAIYFKHNDTVLNLLLKGNLINEDITINNLYLDSSCNGFVFGPKTYCGIKDGYLYVANIYLNGFLLASEIPSDTSYTKRGYFGLTNMVSYKFDIMKAIREYNDNKKQLIKDKILCDGKFHKKMK